jgi:transcription initiation factor TFIIH subunit 2
MEHAPPPPVLAESAVASLVRMGFPQRGAEDAVALCACHGEVKMGGGYICPCCKARVCELPTECHICGLMLVSSPHLARSYHHLFPVPHFEELEGTAMANGRESEFKLCYGCQQELPFPGTHFFLHFLSRFANDFANASFCVAFCVMHGMGRGGSL